MAISVICIVAFLMLVCTGAMIFGLWSMLRVTRTRSTPLVRRERIFSEPVSVLKPLCGADENLVANLTTFFNQDHSNFELIFGVEGADDPAAGVVRRLRKRFPNVATTLVVHQGGRGINPKVSNLRAMMAAVRHDLVVISDSNISVDPDYLVRMVAEMRHGRVGLVTSLVSGSGADCTPTRQSFGAVLESVHLNGPIANSIAASATVGRTIALGKSLLFRRSVFGALGGFQRVANLLAEDYVMGRMYREAGYRVVLSSTFARNVCERTNVAGFLKRRLRWGLMRSRLNPLGYALEPLANPVAVALLGLALGAPAGLMLAWSAGVLALRDGVSWLRFRGPDGLLLAVMAGPLAAFGALGAWLLAPFQKHVSWRGTRVRLSSGTMLYAQHPLRSPGPIYIESAGH